MYRFLKLSCLLILLLLASGGTVDAKTNRIKPKPFKPLVVVGDSNYTFTFLKPMCSIKSAMGYMKQDNGKWASSANRIPFQDENLNNEFYDFFKLGRENFISFNFSKVLVNGDANYLLVVEKLDALPPKKLGGATRYYNKADFFLIDSAELTALLPDSIEHAPKDSTFSTFFKFKIGGTVSYYRSPEEMYTSIAKAIPSTLYRRHLYDTTVRSYFQFCFRKSDLKGKPTLRFNTFFTYAKVGYPIVETNADLFDDQYYSTYMSNIQICDRMLRKELKANKKDAKMSKVEAPPAKSDQE